MDSGRSLWLEECLSRIRDLCHLRRNYRMMTGCRPWPWLSISSCSTQAVSGRMTSKSYVLLILLSDMMYDSSSLRAPTMMIANVSPKKISPTWSRSRLILESSFLILSPCNIPLIRPPDNICVRIYKLFLRAIVDPLFPQRWSSCNNRRSETARWVGLNMGFRVSMTN